jgi:hypothetical protein
LPQTPKIFDRRSDDFNVYVWKIPDDSEAFSLESEDNRGRVNSARIVLRGHNSIVNQV